MPNDPISTTREEASLLDRIAREIVDVEVMKPMEQIGWEHGDPPQVARADNPPQTTQETQKPVTTQADNPPTSTAEPVPATPQLDIDWESLREPNGLILGKYTNTSEAVKGVRHAVDMAKTALRERDSFRKENEELKTRFTTVQAPQPVVTQPPVTTKAPSMLDEVLGKIVSEGGIIAEEDQIALRDAIDTHARTVAREATREILDSQKAATDAEKDKWAAVDSYMSSKYPESGRFVDEISLTVETDPLLKTTVNSLIKDGKEQEAAELAYLTFKRSVDAKSTIEAQKDEVRLTAAEGVRKEAVELARKDAGVMTTMAGGVHEVPNVGPTQEEREAAAAEMRNSGLGHKWRELTFGKYLTDPIFGN